MLPQASCRWDTLSCSCTVWAPGSRRPGAVARGVWLAGSGGPPPLRRGPAPPPGRGFSAGVWLFYAQEARKQSMFREIAPRAFQAPRSTATNPFIRSVHWRYFFEGCSVLPVRYVRVYPHEASPGLFREGPRSPEMKRFDLSLSPATPTLVSRLCWCLVRFTALGGRRQRRASTAARRDLRLRRKSGSRSLASTPRWSALMLLAWR